MAMLIPKGRALAAALAFLACAQAWAVEASAVPKNKQTIAGRYLDAREAYAMKRELGQSAYFVDVRTRYEVAYVGLPTVVDANTRMMPPGTTRRADSGSMSTATSARNWRAGCRRPDSARMRPCS